MVTECVRHLRSDQYDRGISGPGPECNRCQGHHTPGGGVICFDNSDCRANVGANSTPGSTLFTGVSEGYHTVSVEAPADYQDTTRLVKVEYGKITEVDIGLDMFIAPATTTPAAPRATGSIRVYVDRTGSTVCINNGDCYVNVGGSPGQGPVR